MGRGCRPRTAFQLAMRAALAVRAVFFSLPCGQGLQAAQLCFTLPCGQPCSPRSALSLPCGQGLQSAVVFQLAMRARVAVRADVFHLAMRAGVAVRAAAFQLAMRARIAVRAAVFHPAMRARATLCSASSAYHGDTAYSCPSCARGRPARRGMPPLAPRRCRSFSAAPRTETTCVFVRWFASETGSSKKTPFGLLPPRSPHRDDASADLSTRRAHRSVFSDPRRAHRHVGRPRRRRAGRPARFVPRDAHATWSDPRPRAFLISPTRNARDHTRVDAHAHARAPYTPPSGRPRRASPPPRGPRSRRSARRSWRADVSPAATWISWRCAPRRPSISGAASARAPSTPTSSRARSTQTALYAGDVLDAWDTRDDVSHVYVTYDHPESRHTLGVARVAAPAFFRKKFFCSVEKLGEARLVT